MVEQAGILKGFDDQLEPNAVQVAAADADHRFMWSHVDSIEGLKLTKSPGRFGLFLQGVYAEEVAGTTFLAGREHLPQDRFCIAGATG